MIEANWNIPPKVDAESKRHFKPLIYADAVKLLKLSRTTISFSRGDTETYFIVSGIVRGDRTHESRSSIKNVLKARKKVQSQQTVIAIIGRQKIIALIVPVFLLPI